MTDVHPSSVLDGDVQLADDVVVGPFCHLIGPITIGTGTRLISGVHIHGPCTLGSNNLVYPGACLGFAGQDYSFDPSNPGTGLVIGDNNTFREHVSIHRATDPEHPTTVGNHNYLMEQVHVAHDGRLANHITMAGGAHLGGHCWVDDHAVIGGVSGFHQFCRVGRGAIAGACIGFSRDVPPFFLSNIHRSITGINRLGMKRLGMSIEEVRVVRDVFNILYRQQLSIAGALKVLRERDDHPLFAEYVDFIETSRRGITRLADRKTAAQATADPEESVD